MYIAYEVLDWIQHGLFLTIALCAVYGAVMGAMVRDDAFEAANRHPKWVWVALVGGSAFVVALNYPMLSWIGLVVIGLYWFDVYPHVRDIERGVYDW